MDETPCDVIVCKDLLNVLQQDLQDSETSKINQFKLLGIKTNVKNVLKTCIVGFIGSSFNIDDNCPHNLTVCGIAGKAEQIKNVEAHLNNEKFNENQILYLNLIDSQVQLWKLQKLDSGIESEKLNFQIKTKQELKEHLLYFRTCIKFKLDRTTIIPDSIYSRSLLDKKIGINPLFFVEECEQFLNKLEGKKTIGELNIKSKNFDFEVLNIVVYQNLSSAPIDETDLSDYPIIYQENVPFAEELVCCQLDALCIVSKKATYAQAYNLIYDSIIKNIIILDSFMISCPKDPPAVHHFLPDQLCHFVTVVCSYNNTDSYSNVRKKLHNAFYLPKDRPLFRTSNAYEFDGKPIVNDDGLLKNVHEGLSPSGINNGKTSLVQGTYTFYHYGQGGFNDHQWGCAYRSLQTLYSWYRWQGLTNKPVPSIRDIQQILVDIGDKKNDFVGSTNWIGSMEVSFVLNTHIDVTCRIISLRQGETLNSTCLDLAEHFDRHGTPIMIGGGVLAHTILGIDVNEELGTVKYLVLDPHYTGADNIKSIHGKGVFWKDASFWKKDSFYNICLPLNFSEI